MTHKKRAIEQKPPLQSAIIKIQDCVPSSLNVHIKYSHTF